MENSVVQKAANVNTGQRELTASIEFDTIIWPLTQTAMTDVELFDSGNLHSMYRSFQRGKLANKRLIEIKGVTLELGLALTAQSGKDKEELIYFLQNSFLQYKLNDTEYPRIPLSLLSPVDWALTPPSTWAMRAKQNWEYYMLPDSWIISNDLDWHITFKPAADVLPSATATSILKKVRDFALANDLGHFAKFNFLCKLDRPR